MSNPTPSPTPEWEECTSHCSEVGTPGGATHSICTDMGDTRMNPPFGGVVPGTNINSHTMTYGEDDRPEVNIHATTEEDSAFCPCNSHFTQWPNEEPCVCWQCPCVSTSLTITGITAETQCELGYSSVSGTVSATIDIPADEYLEFACNIPILVEIFADEAQSVLLDEIALTIAVNHDGTPSDTTFDSYQIWDQADVGTLYVKATKDNSLEWPLTSLLYSSS